MEASSARLPALSFRVRSVLAGLFCIAFVLALAVPTKSSEAALITVTSLSDFNTAIDTAPTTSDPFDNDIAGGVSITFDSAVTSSLSGGLLTNAADDNQVSGGSFLGEVDGDGLGAPLILTWTFPQAVVGVGVDFVITGRLDATIVGSGVITDIGNTIGGRSGFFGLVDTMNPFTQVQLFVFDNSRNDSFSADNLIFAAAPLVLPEPGTLAVFLFGLAGLGLAGFARKRSLRPALNR